MSDIGCGSRHATSRLARERGYDVVETGGGCTALQKFAKMGEGYVLITDANDPSVPATADRPVLVGWYDDEGDLDREARCENLGVALDLVDDGDATREGVSI